MKEKIHPKYVDCTATCACGASFKTRSTKAAIQVESCSQCHPFYTGKEKMLDTAGRVEKYRRKLSTVKPKKEKKAPAQELAERAKEKDLKKAAAALEKKFAAIEKEAPVPPAAAGGPAQAK